MKILLLLIFIFSVTNVFAQPAKPRRKLPMPKIRKPIPPPPPRELCPKPAKLTDEKAIGQILGSYWCLYPPKAEDISQKTFLWKLKINEDTTLPPETVYQQYFEPSSFRTSTATYFTIQPTEVKKDSDVDKSVDSSSFKFDYFKMEIEKNILILTNEKSKEIEKFRVFLDAKKENILRIQSLKTEKIYEPSEPRPMYPSIGVPSNKNN